MFFVKNPIIKFLFPGLTLYLFWLALYEWWIHPHGFLDRFVIENTIVLSTEMLAWMDYEIFRSGERTIGIAGTPGLFIGDSCNGLSLFVLFSVFIIAFPGNWKRKLVFIPAGIIVIHLLNVLRVVLLAIVLTYSYKWTEFNHTYTFTILIYAVIFGMWLLWVNKVSGFKSSNTSQKAEVRSYK